MNEFNLQPYDPGSAKALLRRRANERYRKWRQRNPERAKEISRLSAQRNKHVRVAWEKANPEKRRDYSLKRVFGLPYGSYDKMLAAQGGVCGICARPPQGRRWFDVDHCHRTNRIRGLLCNPCNRLLGFIEKYLDNPGPFDRWRTR